VGPGPLETLDAAGIRLDRIGDGQKAVLATLSADEVVTVTQLKRRLDEVARAEEIDSRSWWGGSIF
jgi:hypothetical protein